MTPVNATLEEALCDDKSIAVLFAGLTALLLTLTAPQISLTWDEPTYIVAAELYPAWFGELLTQPHLALSEAGVTRYWEFNHEHPPLSKVWSGVVWLGARHVFDDLTAHRFGNILLASLLISLVYLMLARQEGRTAGIVGAIALLTMPRFFFHAHLAALDVPVTVMIFAVTYVFWLGRNKPGLRWTLLLGLVWGLALATKINALVIPPIALSVWALVFRPRRFLIVRLVITGVIGVATFFLTWPWLYHDTLSRVIAYLGFLTIDRGSVEQYYFGHLYTPPPWHFPFVMVAVVVPFTLLLLASLGAFCTVRNEESRPLGGLLLLGTLFSVLILASGQGQIYDNERQLMPVFPYIAALAGIGFARAIPMLEHLAANRKIHLQPTRAVTLLAVGVFVPHVSLAYDLYPHLLSYYSEAVGGAYGAKVLQLETTYWCDSYPQAMDYVNRSASHGSVVWADCQDVLIYHQLHGRLRADLQVANGPDAKTIFTDVELNPATFDEADYVIVQYRQSGFYRALREWMYPREPVHEVMYRRLRLAEVYEQDRFR